MNTVKHVHGGGMPVHVVVLLLILIGLTLVGVGLIGEQFVVPVILATLLTLDVYRTFLKGK